MKIDEVRQLAREKMDEYGLHDWSITFSDGFARLGCCKFKQKELWFSLQYIDRADDDHILDTILHEIAHALVGAGHGHDKVWKAKAVELGAVPRSTAKGIHIPMKWIAICPTCGRTYERMKRVKKGQNRYCGRCHRIYPDEPRKSILKYKKNEEYQKGGE